MLSIEEKQKRQTEAVRRYRERHPEWRERKNALRRTGRPLGRQAVPLSERIWQYVNKTSTCWLWTGAVDKDGYGQTRETISKGVHRSLKAHRAMYELMVGPIPKGLQIDHVKAKGCTSRACVNPDHLEPVVCRENIVRGDGPIIAGNRNAAKTHCPRGHEYNETNTRVDKRGGRHCKACHG